MAIKLLFDISRSSSLRSCFASQISDVSIDISVTDEGKTNVGVDIIAFLAEVGVDEAGARGLLTFAGLEGIDGSVWARIGAKGLRAIALGR